MIDIRFSNEKDVCKANVEKISDSVIQIKGVDQNLSGFVILSDTGFVFAKYEDYNTLYRVVDGGFQLSSDGSVYTEPEPVESTLEGLKQQKE